MPTEVANEGGERTKPEGRGLERYRERDMRILLSEKEANRFWAQVDKSGECWEWTGTRSRGYGAFKLLRVRASALMAHRVSWEISNGMIVDGLFVCHRCDNKRCVRPDHLFLGTNRDNQLDAVAKGRTRGRGRWITLNQRAEVAALYKTGRYTIQRLADMYEVSTMPIWRITRHLAKPVLSKSKDAGV